MPWSLSESTDTLVRLAECMSETQPWGTGVLANLHLRVDAFGASLTHRYLPQVPCFRVIALDAISGYLIKLDLCLTL